ncbi:MAG: PD-(D/E)XK nuclease family protein [Bdellovibrionia bacterium]
MNWNLETGVHAGRGYEYDVVDAIEPSQGYQPALKESVRVREQLKPKASAAAHRSITEIIGKKDSGSDYLTRTKVRLKKSLDGVSIHALFESLRFIDDLPDDLLQIRFGERAPSIRSAIRYVKGIESVPVARLLKSGFVEWGFVLTEGDEKIPGRIDLWGLADGKAWIIDYKTGDPERVEDAFEQLSIYSVALRRFGIKEPMQMAVIFPLSEQTHVREAPPEKDVLKKYLIGKKISQ